MSDLRDQARRAIASLDLARLGADCDAAAVAALCGRACTRFGPVAAVCVPPGHVVRARRELLGMPVKVATVANFPEGGRDHAPVIAETRRAVADGADEIDLVMPYRAILTDHPEIARSMVERVKAAAGPALLKVILESGVLGDPDLIRQAGEIAIAGGADFLKTSTGKAPVNATPRGARVVLETIRDAGRPVGFMAAGGLRSTAEAARYLELADEIMGPGWATPKTFRLGASGVLEALIATLEGKTR